MLSLYHPFIQQELIEQAFHGARVLCWLSGPEDIPDGQRKTARLLGRVFGSAVLFINEPAARG